MANASACCRASSLGQRVAWVSFGQQRETETHRNPSIRSAPALVVTGRRDQPKLDQERGRLKLGIAAEVHAHHGHRLAQFTLEHVLARPRLAPFPDTALSTSFLGGPPALVTSVVVELQLEVYGCLIVGSGRIIVHVHLAAVLVDDGARGDFPGSCGHGVPVSGF